MTIDEDYQKDLEIVAYHEVGHAVVAKLLGRRIRYIKLSYNKQAKMWGGETFKDDLPVNDPHWSSLNLDSLIPYDELQFQYPRYPQPCEEFKIGRELCAIDYAGIVTEELLNNQRGIDGNPELFPQNTKDIIDANRRLQRFPCEEWEEELNNAKSHTRVILTNPIGWSLVENLSKKLTNDILRGRIPDESYDLANHWYFTFIELYKSFYQVLTKGEN